MNPAYYPNRMIGVNIRMPPDLLDDLSYAAEIEQRTVRQLIRNVLRVEMAKRGLLDYYDVALPLLLASEGPNDTSV